MSRPAQLPYQPFMPEIQIHALAQYSHIFPEVQAANLVLREGKFDEFLLASKVLVRQAPVAALYANIAHTQFCMGSIAEAEMSANIALVLHPVDAVAMGIRARCRMSRVSSRDFLGAMADFDYIKDRSHSEYQQQAMSQCRNVIAIAEAEQKKAKKRKNGKNTSQQYTAALLNGREASQNLLNRATQLTQEILTDFAKEHGHVQQQQPINLIADSSTAAMLQPAILPSVDMARVPLHPALPDTTCPESSTDANASQSPATAISTEELSLATTASSSTSAADAKSHVSPLDVEDLTQQTQVANVPKEVAGSQPEQSPLTAPLPGLTHVGPFEAGKENAAAALAASAADHGLPEQPLQSCNSDCQNWAAKYLQTINEWRGPLL